MNSTAQPPQAPLLLRTARGEVVERPPVWAMRQAGRWDPEFNRLRAGLPFYAFAERVELAARASLLPRRFGVDAIILFYDITTLAVSMGLSFAFQPGRGPVPVQPVRTAADLARLDPTPEPARFGHVLDLLQRVREELRGELPVIVFAGAPFTLACYCLGLGKDVPAVRRFAAELPQLWRQLLQRLTTATIHFLRCLTAAGADLYQLFDSWAGQLPRADYEAWAQPGQVEVFAAVRSVPRILFVKEGPYLDLMVASGADVISLGTRHDLAEARRNYPHLVFQGNVDCELLRRGTAAEVIAATRRCLQAGGGQRHIVNLNHGLAPETPVANFEAFVRTVHEYRSHT